MGKKGKRSCVIQLPAASKRRWVESEDVEQRESTEHVAWPSTSKSFYLDIPLFEHPEQPEEEPIPMSRTEKKLELSASSSVTEADTPEDNSRTVAELSFINNLVSEHAREKGIELMEDTVLEICVSYDGTWMKRGHTSRIGIGCVIDVMTGLVLDAELLSTYCHTCGTTGTWVKGNTPQRYDVWYDEHRADCCINYACTSGNMEVVAAELLWTRSVDNHRLRYTSMLSDGDAQRLS
ncbi:hypothetical protein PoB_000755200 [Plakobranchus ocellatus]|uniref:Mutator-like transposase domain-containing protein n=1 Tax=Plakobranchus ocellatus TaxID=259542 RepID=A0AAV3YDT5_9GAST|nr:hypothetical protein PoB_000755200 [Plakobranchus ocellatus]